MYCITHDGEVTYDLLGITKEEMILLNTLLRYSRHSNPKDQATRRRLYFTTPDTEEHPASSFISAKEER